MTVYWSLGHKLTDYEQFLQFFLSDDNVNEKKNYQHIEILTYAAHYSQTGY
jgi:hypothetical protein